MMNAKQLLALVFAALAAHSALSRELPQRCGFEHECWPRPVCLEHVRPCAPGPQLDEDLVNGYGDPRGCCPPPFMPYPHRLLIAE
jgi:hypothetical protein